MSLLSNRSSTALNNIFVFTFYSLTQNLFISDLILDQALHGKWMGIQWKQWQTLFFWTPNITADGDCSHEIKRHFLLGRKVMTNLDSILISRDVTSLTKAHLVKAMVFPVVMYGYESWTIKKAECWRIDAFELWCWRRLKSLELQRDQNSQS